MVDYLNLGKLCRIAAVAVHEAKSSELKISQEIINSALLCLNPLRPFFRQEDKDTIELLIFDEFIYFFLHHFSRLISEIDKTRMALIDSVTMWVIYSNIERIWGSLTNDEKSKLITDMYEDLNEKEKEYSKCKNIISKISNDSNIETSILQSDGTVNKLVVSLVLLIFGKIDIYDEKEGLFVKTVVDSVIEILSEKKDEWNEIVKKSIQEMDPA